MKRKKNRAMIGDDGDREWPCKHGVGHGNNVHTCCGEKCHKEAMKAKQNYDDFEKAGAD